MEEPKERNQNPARFFSWHKLKVMAIITTASRRIRTELKVLSGATTGDLETAYNAYESGLAGDGTKTWSVRIVSAYFDGSNYIAVAEAQYPETSDNPLGSIPEV